MQEAFAGGAHVMLEEGTQAEWLHDLLSRPVGARGRLQRDQLRSVATLGSRADRLAWA